MVPPRGRRPVGRRQNPRSRRDLDAHAPDKIGPDTEALSGCSNAPDGEEWLVLQQVMCMLRMSRSLVYAGMKRRGFPRPTRIGPRDQRWLAREVYAWVRSRPRAGSRRPAGATLR